MLSKIESPHDLQRLSLAELEQLAAEMREVLCNLVATRSAHFASNLGVVELCLALHSVFDFRHDRLIWDTGHQIYPHKLITGRYHEFQHDPHQGRPDGLPQPGRKRVRPVHDRPRRLQRLDGARPARAATTCCGETDRSSVAVIGDGAFPIRHRLRGA